MTPREKILRDGLDRVMPHIRLMRARDHKAQFIEESLYDLIAEADAVKDGPSEEPEDREWILALEKRFPLEKYTRENQHDMDAILDMIARLKKYMRIE